MDSSSSSVLNGILHLHDANLAGTEHSACCTLILIEGYAAESLAVGALAEITKNTFVEKRLLDVASKQKGDEYSQLSGRKIDGKYTICGRDYFGVYALSRRITNVSKSEAEDEEVVNIGSILGLDLRHGVSEEESASLRYGRVILMMDRDEDASHMKGLLLNMFRIRCPMIFRGYGFLAQFITPLYRVFYSSPSREPDDHYTVLDFTDSQKRRETADHTIREYKSLETFTPKEIKDFFSDFEKYCVYFRYNGKEDDQIIMDVFGKTSSGRKKLLQKSHHPITYKNNMTEISYKDFIINDLIVYGDLHNFRSLKSTVDGLSGSQRKVLDLCFEECVDDEERVESLISKMSLTGYKQSAKSFGETIINMAQDFVGSNNINILEPLGHFGTRIRGGQDAGKVRYLSTKVNRLARYIFPGFKKMGKSTESEYYLPIIPMILVNGAKGIGYGWNTDIPKYNPSDIIDNILRIMSGYEPCEMFPWYRNFSGKITKKGGSNEGTTFYNSGVLKLSELRNEIHITELPVGVYAQNYKQKVLDVMPKTSLKIKQCKEYHSITNVHFRITLEKPWNKSEEELFDILKLRRLIKPHFVAFDHEGRVKQYKNSCEILREFYDLRLIEYVKKNIKSEGNMPDGEQQAFNQTTQKGREVGFEKKLSEIDDSSRSCKDEPSHGIKVENTAYFSTSSESSNVEKNVCSSTNSAEDLSVNSVKQDFETMSIKPENEELSAKAKMQWKSELKELKSRKNCFFASS